MELVTVVPVIVAVLELLLKVAVTIALWLLAKVAAAMALKVAVAVPAAAVTDAGTVSSVLLLDSVTLDPPAGALWVRVTAHVPTPPGLRLAGLQASVETRTGAWSVIVEVFELPPKVAVMIAA
jgi:hypothetical protein